MFSIFSVCSANAGDNMKAFPHPDQGQVRYVIQLAEKDDASNFQVELMVGKTIEIDDVNQYFFGGQIKSESIAGWGFTRYVVSELGPIMTAIVVAGRSGSAFAAEIGSMQISEEIDALFVMGFQPTLFLAAPRIVAAMIVVPLLTLFADIFAIAGGLVVGVTMLDLTPHSYIAQTMKTLTLFEVMWGLMKSAVFAALVSWVGCLRGFQARGGADGVGSAVTSAVVTAIFLIILFDSVFAVIRSYW
jgi:phospholipid/cholesterol/gamma-HCH transport system permease protein